MAKLKETAGTMITMDIFILNMEQLLRNKALFLCAIISNRKRWICQYWIINEQALAETA